MSPGRGLTEGPVQGWTSPVVVATLAAGVVFAVAFLVVEERAANPMLPLRIFRSVQFSAANGVTFVVYGALGGALFLLPVVLQGAAGYPPLQAGLALLPVTVIMLALSSRSGALAARIGPRLQMSVGPVVIGSGPPADTLSHAGRGGDRAPRVRYFDTPSCLSR